MTIDDQRLPGRPYGSSHSCGDLRQSAETRSIDAESARTLRPGASPVGTRPRS